MSDEGKMTNYSDEGNVALWFAKRTKITTVINEEGVTGIGEYAFCVCLKIENTTVAPTVKGLGAGAFKNCTKLSSVSTPRRRCEDCRFYL